MKSGMSDHTCHLNTWDMKANSGVEVHPRLHCEFKASLNYIRWKTERDKGKKETAYEPLFLKTIVWVINTEVEI